MCSWVLCFASQTNKCTQRSQHGCSYGILSQTLVNVRLLAALAGHQHISVTQRYIDVNDTQLANARVAVMAKQKARAIEKQLHRALKQREWLRRTSNSGQLRACEKEILIKRTKLIL